MRVLVGSWLEAVGTDGRVGSVLGDCEGLPGWFGFHICFVLPFVCCWIQAPEQPCGAVSAFRANQAELLVSYSFAWAVKAAQAAQSLLFSAS